MIIYKYVRYYQEYEEKMQCSAEQAVERAISDIEHTQAVPLSISNENGSVIYSEEQIEEAFYHGGVIVESKSETRLIEQ